MLHRRILLANSIIKRIDEYTYTYKIHYSIDPSYSEVISTDWNSYDYPIYETYIDTELLTWRIYGNDGGYDDIIIKAPENVTLHYDQYEDGYRPNYVFEGSFTIPVNINSNGFNIELTCNGNGAYHDDIRGFAHGSSLIIQKGYIDDSDDTRDPIKVDAVAEGEISKKLSAENLQTEFVNNNEITIIFHGSLRLIPTKYPFIIEEKQGDYYLHMADHVTEDVEVLFPDPEYYVRVDGVLTINGDTEHVSSGPIKVNQSNLAPTSGWKLQDIFQAYTNSLVDGTAIPILDSNAWEFTFLDDVYQSRWENPDSPGEDTRHISHFQWICDFNSDGNGYGYYYN